jgi:hypothetical protein
MNELVKRTNLNLIDVTKTPVHGVSYLFKLTKNKSVDGTKVINRLEDERQKGLYDKKTYNRYKTNITNLVRDFKEMIKSWSAIKYHLIGYGAAAKGMTLLNFANVKLDYIIDDNEMKQNLYTPGTNIIIKPNSFLKEYNKDDKILFIPLAWNFYDEIRKRIKDVRDNDNDCFLKYFPNVRIER